MSKKIALNTDARWLTAMEKLYKRDPWAAHTIVALAEVQADYKELDLDEQSTMFLSTIAARMPWQMNFATKIAAEFYGALRAA